MFGALQAGASGFLLKDTPPADIIRAVRLVAGGEAMLSPSAARALIDKFSADPAAPRRAAAERALQVLTGREREVAAEVAQGHSNADIAAHLYMSEATVKAHLSRVLTKLDAANRVQVAILARDAGLVLLRRHRGAVGRVGDDPDRRPPQVCRDVLRHALPGGAEEVLGDVADVRGDDDAVQ